MTVVSYKCPVCGMSVPEAVGRYAQHNDGYDNPCFQGGMRLPPRACQVNSHCGLRDTHVGECWIMPSDGEVLAPL